MHQYTLLHDPLNYRAVADTTSGIVEWQAHQRNIWLNNCERCPQMLQHITQTELLVATQTTYKALLGAGWPCHIEDQRKPFCATLLIALAA